MLKKTFEFEFSACASEMRNAEVCNNNEVLALEGIFTFFITTFNGICTFLHYLYFFEKPQFPKSPFPQ